MNNFNDCPVEPEVHEQEKRQYTKADKKGLILVIGLFVAVAVIFLTLRSSSDTNPAAVSTTAVQVSASTTAATLPSAVQTTQTTTAAVPIATAPIPTSAPTTEASTVTAAPSTTLTTTAPTTEVTTTQKKEPDKEEILAAINEGINSLKSDTASFTAVKKQVISIDLLDCSVPALTGAINTVVDFFEGEEVIEYDITNGKGPNPEKKGEETVVNHEIPPTDKPFTLTIDGVAEAKAEETDRGTLYTIKVVSETSTLENPRPPHHNAACDTLDFSTFSLPLGELTKVDFEYPGATVSVIVDASGKPVQYRERLEMKGTGEGNAFGISGSGTLEGYVDEVWDIQWK